MFFLYELKNVKLKVFGTNWESQPDFNACC